MSNIIIFSPFKNNILDYLNTVMTDKDGNKVLITQDMHMNFNIMINNNIVFASKDNIEISAYLNKLFLRIN